MRGLIWGILVVAACGGDASTGAVDTETAEHYCREGCTYQSACNGDPVEPCVAGCVDDVVGWYREDTLAGLVDCVTSLPCGESDDACFTACAPTASHERYEAACRDALTDCGASPEDLAPVCETTPAASGDVGILCVIAPAILEEMTGCFTDPDVSCTTYEPCLSSVLASHGVDF